MGTTVDQVNHCELRRPTLRVSETVHIHLDPRYTTRVGGGKGPSDGDSTEDLESKE